MDDFSDKQLKTLQTVVSEAVKVNNEYLLQEMDDKFRINNGILRQEIRAVKTELRGEFRQEMVQMKDDIITGIGEILDNHVLPQIDNHEVRLTTLETKMA